MIYHALASDPATGKPATSWWAVHAETLTPVRIDATLNRALQIDVIAPPPGEPTEFASHPQLAFDPKAIAREVFKDVQRNLIPGATHLKRRLLKRSDITVPEYLLVFNGAGEQPAIFRTQEPHLVVPANPDNESILTQPAYWRTATDIPVLGWEYWWTDCQNAFDELAPAFVASQS